MTLARPIPETDGLAGSFWKAAENNRLSIQRCLGCHSFQHYARQVCLTCGGKTLEFYDVSGSGRVVSCTTIHKSPYDDILTPYVLALVRLDEGVILLTHLVNGKPNENYCDFSVQLKFADFRDGFKLPVFILEGQE